MDKVGFILIGVLVGVVIIFNAVSIAVIITQRITVKDTLVEVKECSLGEVLLTPLVLPAIVFLLLFNLLNWKPFQGKDNE
jgi:hypothetical protein